MIQSSNNKPAAITLLPPVRTGSKPYHGEEIIIICSWKCTDTFTLMSCGVCPVTLNVNFKSYICCFE